LVTDGFGLCQWFGYQRRQKNIENRDLIFLMKRWRKNLSAKNLILFKREFPEFNFQEIFLDFRGTCSWQQKYLLSLLNAFLYGIDEKKMTNYAICSS